MLKRDNIANLLNQQILLEELEKKEGKKIEEENNKSKILIFIFDRRSYHVFYAIF